MTLDSGDSVWIPCEVTSGVFPDERKVRIASDAGDFTGYVNVAQLKDATTHGPSAIRATIVERSEHEISARLPGQTRRQQYLKMRV
jgi:hypothetical protein